ncbi:MAG: hypothetical protein BM562_14435 [Alphaproteobacteria bacterium MedPE-SWcel]|nr:MAG: hypothetical protein BM562_14435 [Alphaproteobacteria bacterium MedPE-SWcel]
MTAPTVAFGTENSRLFVSETTLVFDTETGEENQPGEIVVEDIEGFRTLLSAHPAVTEVRLDSGGGSVYASSEIAWIVADYGLNTTVQGECISACVDIFLAGARRQMTRGSKIGFHRRSWSPNSVESYYTDLRESRGWDTPFVFGSWIYEDTQREMYDYLNYMVDRGVDPGFAIKTLQMDPGDEWYPSRRTLVAAGVLRDKAP